MPCTSKRKAHTSLETILFTPGFSPVIEDSYDWRNRFNGFLFSPSRLDFAGDREVAFLKRDDENR